MTVFTVDTIVFFYDWQLSFSKCIDRYLCLCPVNILHFLENCAVNTMLSAFRLLWKEHTSVYTCIKKMIGVYDSDLFLSCSESTIICLFVSASLHLGAIVDCRFSVRPDKSSVVRIPRRGSQKFDRETDGRL